MLRRRQRREPCKAIFKGDLAKKRSTCTMDGFFSTFSTFEKIFCVFLRSILFFLLVDVLNHMDRILWDTTGYTAKNMKINHDIWDRLS